MKNNLKRMMMWLLPGGGIFLVDRLFKLWFQDVDMALIPGVLALRSAKNTGMAMGLFSGNTLLLFLLSVVLMGGCTFFLRRYRLSGLAVISISLMAGGALGNMVDRLFLGYVVDMIDFEWIDFYIFNIADVGVVCGAVLCGISMLFRPGEWESK